MATKIIPINPRSKNITEGKSRAPNRSMYYAMGYEESDFKKPMVGVANGHSTITPCNSGLQKLADAAVQGISGVLALDAVLQLIVDHVRDLADAQYAALGIVGDLDESLLKRWAGVKDSGRLLPEFGGALDMIDSFLISAPVAWGVAWMLR